MRRPSGRAILGGSLVLAAVLLGMAWWERAGRIESPVSVQRRPRVRPDPTDAVIPPNLAPLSLLVEETGDRYQVRLSSAKGTPITLTRSTPAIGIPPGPWMRLLAENRGQSLFWDISARQENGEWRRFGTMSSRIAEEEIDAFLVYRKVGPVYNFWTDMGIYQRDLGTYEERRVLGGAQFISGAGLAGPCINCHAFQNNRPDRMTVAIRSLSHGSSTPLLSGGTLSKIGTKFGYTSWHPNGRVAAYSLNKVRQFFHASGPEVRDVIDLDSDLAWYDTEERQVRTAPGLSNPNRLETYPSWSADGRFLYFCSAPILWSDYDRIPPDRYQDVRYDLMRIPYDADRGTWGEVETVLSSAETGRSILLPRASPDGRFLLFCMCDYGCFPVYQPSSDLYLMDLRTNAYRKLDINSPRSESWHSWSSNSRWFAFSSKRQDGLFTRLYISYFDRDGVAHGPLLLPQSDPTFYDSCLKTYSVPELITGPVSVSARHLAQTVRSPDAIQVAVPDMSVTRVRDKAPAWRPAVPERE